MHFITNGYKRFSKTKSTEPRQRVPLIWIIHFVCKSSYTSFSTLHKDISYNLFWIRYKIRLTLGKAYIICQIGTPLRTIYRNRQKSQQHQLLSDTDTHFILMWKYWRDLPAHERHVLVWYPIHCPGTWIETMVVGLTSWEFPLPCLIQVFVGDFAGI